MLWGSLLWRWVGGLSFSHEWRYRLFKEALLHAVPQIVEVTILVQLFAHLKL